MERTVGRPVSNRTRPANRSIIGEANLDSDARVLIVLSATLGQPTLSFFLSARANWRPNLHAGSPRLLLAIAYHPSACMYRPRYIIIVINSLFSLTKRRHTHTYLESDSVNDNRQTMNCCKRSMLSADCHPPITTVNSLTSEQRGD